MTHIESKYSRAQELWYELDEPKAFAAMKREHIDCIDVIVALNAKIAARYAYFLDYGARRAA